MNLTDGIRNIKGVGEQAERRFNQLHIETVDQLIHHMPRDYDVYRPVQSIASIQVGELVAIEGMLSTRVSLKRVRNLKLITCKVQDSTGTLAVTWFNMPFLQRQLRTGTYYILRGRASLHNGQLVLEQPQILSRQEFESKLRILWPQYPLTAGITNNMITKCVKNALAELGRIPDELPAAMRKRNQLMDETGALREIHFPKSYETMLDARRRLVFDEFYRFLLQLSRLKEEKEQIRTEFVWNDTTRCDELLQRLPYQLTSAQMRVWQEIQKDCTSKVAMNRLIQGDVGSGKTVVAMLALLLAVSHGCQGALMVPTEVLAGQHYEGFEKMLAPLGVRIQLLTGAMTAAAKRKAYAAIEAHEVDIVIGTHALIQEKVTYARLALVITDEQHRFGVRQRERLEAKGERMHVLAMSATPIPRSLAILLYGDMDLSIMNEMPANRLPVKTCVIQDHARRTAIHFLEKEIAQGHQCYVICPMVGLPKGDESSSAATDLDLENVIDYTEELIEQLPKDTCVEYLHGKMKSADKTSIMERYAAGEIQVLVSTTVIEVGINVPNATVIMIENAERFGLAQLHQLRGRVGRGSEQSYCILVQGNRSREATERLEVLNHSYDGFYIAEEDLRLRGPGDLFGIRQSGELAFVLGDIYQDADVLELAANEVKNLQTIPD